MAEPLDPAQIEKDLDLVFGVLQDAVTRGDIPQEVLKRMRLLVSRDKEAHERRAQAERAWLDRISAALNAAGGAYTSIGRPTNY